jgi:hypothetical protein
VEKKSAAPTQASGKENSTNQSDAAELRDRLTTLAEREKRVIELLNCSSGDQIEHKLRNLIHEVQLMRAIVNRMEDDQQ